MPVLPSASPHQGVLGKAGGWPPPPWAHDTQSVLSSGQHLNTYSYTKINIKFMSSVWREVKYPWKSVSVSECVFMHSCITVYTWMFSCKGASNVAPRVQTHNTHWSSVTLGCLFKEGCSLLSISRPSRQQSRFYKGTAGDVLPSVLAFFVPSDAVSSWVWAREAATRHSRELCNKSTSLGLPYNNNPQSIHNILSVYCMWTA